jgi:glycolate oxidase
VILEITVKLLPKPETAQVVMASFADVEKRGRSRGRVIGAGIVPAGSR